MIQPFHIHERNHYSYRLSTIQEETIMSVHFLYFGGRNGSSNEQRKAYNVASYRSLFTRLAFNSDSTPREDSKFQSVREAFQTQPNYLGGKWKTSESCKATGEASNN